MKRAGRLWSQVLAFENLLWAYRKARKGKRQRDEVARFSLNLEYELLQLQTELSQFTYRPSPYRQFNIYERKPRLIAAAPFRDRVVHHAVMNIVEPLLDKSFIADSYACRKHKGVHKAVDRYQQWAKRYAYALKLDIASYFPSIDHAILREQIHHHLKDKYVLWLLDVLLEHAPTQTGAVPIYFAGDDLFTPSTRRIGLPIGNLTSQILANLYLNQLDHFIKEKLRAPAYLRYVDDLILLGDNNRQLWTWKNAIEQELHALRLRIHPSKVNLYRTWLGVDVLGYRVFPHYRLLRNDNGFRFRRKLQGFAEAYKHSTLLWQDFNPSVQSWLGHAQHANTYGLRDRIFSEVSFQRE
ncbi:MAG: RNA-directed DNA polymerase [Thiothrix sp.]|nr:MAG: RNA-directed DNA polymerase [Thiothrix sp.]